MNIANISALAEQLNTIGVENATSALVRRICFRPQKFTLITKVEKGDETVGLRIFFEKLSTDDLYTLLYYDTTLQHEAQLPGDINGFDVTALDKEMAGIDWVSAFDSDNGKVVVLEDEKTWAQESRIAAITDGLSQLETSEEGKIVAALLKQKHWFGTEYLNVVGPVIPAANKSEISQRFYVQEGQPLISVEEAYRFLRNKWLEKYVQMKKKEPADKVKEVKQSGNASSRARTPKNNKPGSRRINVR